MTPFRITPALVLVMVAVLLAMTGSCSVKGAEADAGMMYASAKDPAITENHFGSPSCNVTEHKEYRVVQGEPFIYTGTVPEHADRSVDVYVFSDLVPVLIPWQRPVDANGTFSFTLTGNATRQVWEDHLSYRLPGSSFFSSPYDHICLRFSTGSRCFDLQVVQDTRNLTLNRTNDWIRIDPLPDQIVSEKDRPEYSGNFFINGTTNLQQGTELVLTMGSTCMLPCPKMASDDIGCCGKRL